ncbi:carbohydrate-binding protein [Thalassobellus sediminis]|uniref:carbohydrate-binding protein n=1 Tax=Thalassobellus sediminis TaxID=3367753 RepID=UPI003794D7C4
MKNIKFIYSKIILLSGLLLIVTTSCEREISDEVEFATFDKTGEIFTDSPIGLGSDFYFPFQGSKATAWTVDDNEGYESQSSMRFDVPNANDPEGGYAGAIFRVDGAGRDLTGYDALTFWAKASQGITIGEMGFGTDFIDNKYQVGSSNVMLSTNWVKYTIPIPDPSKLTEERGLFWYSAGTQDTDGFGYTFWIDDLKFEKLGTIGQSKPVILNGVDIEQIGFTGITVDLTGLTQTFNLGSGMNTTINVAPSYYDFSSSDPSVASVNGLGIISIEKTGEATISASLAGVESTGSLALEVIGAFDFAPTPPVRNAGDVISIFSDAYNNVPVDYYNGFFLDGFQTTEGGSPPLDVNGDAIINYTKLNFVGIGTFQDVASVNATNMTHLHVDIKVNEAINTADFITLELLNSVGNNETSGSVRFNSDAFTADEWVSLDVPLSEFGLSDLSQLGLLFFITDATISDIFVDNIYYYK